MTATLLVADDNEANRELARSTLEDEGYRVVLATGGEAAVQAFGREAPDCVLLDVRMPEVDGFTACERIRALPTGAEVPILFLTALRDVDTFDRALAVGGDDFLTKPVRPAELVARVQTALKLRKMRVELREYYELLRKQRDDMLRLQLQKERLMAFVVHDLKNPVSSMDLHAQVMLRDKGLGNDTRASALQIRTEARHLTRMILNLLDVSKGDEGKLSAKRADVDVSLLVSQVTDELDLAARGANVRLVHEVEVPTIRADADLLRRMLTNLVENSLRHAPADSAVTITVRRIQNEQNEIELRVADTGPGIPLELRERIFEPFVQMEGSGARPPPSRGGRGLGLTFCRLVVEAHGGRIWVEDGSLGAVFCARLSNDG